MTDPKKSITHEEAREGVRNDTSGWTLEDFSMLDRYIDQQLALDSRPASQPAPQGYRFGEGDVERLSEAFDASAMEEGDAMALARAALSALGAPSQSKPSDGPAWRERALELAKEILAMTRGDHVLGLGAVNDIADKTRELVALLEAIPSETEKP